MLHADGYMLSDYITFPVTEPAAVHARNGVAYNPAKGGDFMAAVQTHLPPSMSVIRLKGMDSSEIKDVLSHAQVYVDAGHHPGKDRIPREAAALGCIVLVSQKGSGNDNNDVPLPSSHKFRLVDGPKAVARRIIECDEDPTAMLAGQDVYRGAIREEKSILRREVRRIFGEGGPL
ncbi:hypothetical protein NYO98_09960 [Nocardioides sp. STR2]|uniref:Uncharacterized protein n=1 Tax=Nocardioides pini TaxID=2975053 RepID=A0ABT4CCR5_9ACTN|nr:hypothetical protein [Nocardioides pini]MCY4726601.1 hypothetical protein [Nocardioides pini]